MPYPSTKQRSKVVAFLSRNKVIVFIVFNFFLESAIEETSKQLGSLRTPGATPRSSSPADREATPVSTPKSQPWD